MDPNETLKMIRSRIRRLNVGQPFRNDGEELAELVEALDEWLTKGGFLPSDWER